jgi:ribonuclease HI
VEVIVHTSYKMKKNRAIELTSEWVSSEEAIRLAEDWQSKGPFLSIRIEDRMEREWTLKEFKKLNEEVESEPDEIDLYFDGGYDFQSKKAGIGIVIFYSKGKQRFRRRKNMLLEQLESNNEAEYAALFSGLMELEEMLVKNSIVRIWGDSLVVINQALGEWACLEPSLSAWLDRVENKINQLHLTAQFTAIKRNDNKEADQLAKQALEGVSIESEKKIDNHI